MSQEVSSQVFKCSYEDWWEMKLIASLDGEAHYYRK